MSTDPSGSFFNTVAGNILATLGLNPQPKKSDTNSTPFFYSQFTTITDPSGGTLRNILCNNSFSVNFTPPFNQYGLAQASISAAVSLRNISGANLYTGTSFQNQIVMAPIQATAIYQTSGSLSLVFSYPDKDTIMYPNYNPFDSVILSVTKNEMSAITSQNYSAYKLTTPFYFPGINTSTPAPEIDNYNLPDFYDIYLVFYSTTLTSVNANASGNYTFTPVSIQQIINADPSKPYPFTVAMMAVRNSASITTKSDNFYLFNPAVINQSTISEPSFKTFTTSVYNNLAPAIGRGARLLSVLFFNNFYTVPSLSQSVSCVFGQNVLTSTGIPPFSDFCNLPVCKLGATSACPNTF
jgi:hypothetical protein